MTDEELFQARKEYEYKYAELSKLEQDSNVKRYIELKELNILSKEELAIEILKKYGKKTKEPNNIYIHVGYRTRDWGMFISVTHKYKNIETQEVNFLFQDEDKFLSENIIIDYFPHDKFKEDEVKQIINDYYKYVYEASQEEAVQKIKSKYIKPKK